MVYTTHVNLVLHQASVERIFEEQIESAFGHIDNIVQRVGCILRYIESINLMF
jgi:hypothetical protein